MRDGIDEAVIFMDKTSLQHAAEVVLTALFDRLETCVPGCVTAADSARSFDAVSGSFTNYAYGALEQAAATLAFMGTAAGYLEGIGIADLRSDLLEPVARDFMRGRLQNPGVLIPDCLELSKRFIDYLDSI